jgi:hypothetical protein
MTDMAVVGETAVSKRPYREALEEMLVDVQAIKYGGIRTIFVLLVWAAQVLSDLKADSLSLQMTSLVVAIALTRTIFQRPVHQWVADYYHRNIRGYVIHFLQSDLRDQEVPHVTLRGLQSSDWKFQCHQSITIPVAGWLKGSAKVYDGHRENKGWRLRVVKGRLSDPYRLILRARDRKDNSVLVDLSVLLDRDLSYAQELRFDVAQQSC